MVFIPIVILALIIALIVNALVRNAMTNTNEPAEVVELTEEAETSDTVEDTGDIDVEDPDFHTGQPNPVAEIDIDILQEGTGEAMAKDGDTLSVHYTGTLEDGTKFDSSLDRGTPFTLTLGQNQVIQGWELGLQNMKVGEKRRLTIPADLAYGERAVSIIPPNSTLIFEVELISMN